MGRILPRVKRGHPTEWSSTADHLRSPSKSGPRRKLPSGVTSIRHPSESKASCWYHECPIVWKIDSKERARRFMVSLANNSVPRWLGTRGGPNKEQCKIDPGLSWKNRKRKRSTPVHGLSSPLTLFGRPIAKQEWSPESPHEVMREKQICLPSQCASLLKSQEGDLRH